MTTPERLERNLSSILGDLAMGPTPEYLDDVFSQTGRMRQRPAWTFPERWLPVADITSRQAFAPRVPLRSIGVALVILALLIGAALVYVGSHQTRVPPPFGPAANGQIPFVSGGALYMGDLTTGATRQLVGAPGGDIGVPQTSPDGTRVAFLRTAMDAIGADPVDIYVVRTDGSDLRRITATPLPDWRFIRWAPDGRDLLVGHPVVYSGDGCALTTCLTDQLDLFDASGKGTVVTLARADSLTEATYRPPAGNEILYRAGFSTGGADPNFSLYVMHADGSDVHKVAERAVDGSSGDLESPVYSADGQRILVNRWTSNASFGKPGCCQLFVMNADGSDEHQFIPNQGVDGNWDGAATVSPDGTMIAFWHGTGAPTHGIAVIRADGTGPIVDTGPGQVKPASYIWSPDSSKILMYSGDGASTNAYVLDPKGGPWTTVPWSQNGDLDWQRLAP